MPLTVICQAPVIINKYECPKSGLLRRQPALLTSEPIWRCLIGPLATKKSRSFCFKAGRYRSETPRSGSRSQFIPLSNGLIWILTKARLGRAIRALPPIGKIKRYQEAAQELIKTGAAYEKDGAVWLIMPKDITLGWEDAVRGQIDFDSNQLKDWVILKSDLNPTYNLPMLLMIWISRSPMSSAVKSTSVIPLYNFPFTEIWKRNPRSFPTCCRYCGLPIIKKN